MAESREGQNLPAFQSLQLDFTAHVRDPVNNPIPSDIEKRRMDIYVRLVYNNIENFCASRFPRAKALLGDERWHELIRDFVHHHQSKSPYFSQIGDEFIAFLISERENVSDPVFLVELCHFEWLPMYLDRLADELPDYEMCTDPLTTTLQASPLAIARRYSWPVTEVSQTLVPSEPPESPTWILAFRNRADKVDVRHTDELSANLIEALREPGTGEEAIRRVVGNAFDLTDERRAQFTDRLIDLIELDVLILA